MTAAERLAKEFSKPYMVKLYTATAYDTYKFYLEEPNPVAFMDYKSAEKWLQGRGYAYSHTEDGAQIWID